MTAAELLSELGAYIGFAHLSLDSGGVCGLDFNEDVHVDLERDPADENILIMHSVLRTLPPECMEKRYWQMLAGSLRKNDPFGVVLSLDPATGETVIWTSVNCEQSHAEQLSQCLDRFVRAISDWTARLEQSHEPDSSAEQVEAELRDFAHMIRV